MVGSTHSGNYPLLYGSARTKKHGQMHEPYKPKAVPPYSHIRILSPPSSTTNGDGEMPMPFVRKQSLQTELKLFADQKLAFGLQSPKNISAPTSFAEAAAMPPIRHGTEHGNLRGASYDIASVESSPGPVPHSSISSNGPSKYLTLKPTKSKKKKWSPLDLSEIELIENTASTTDPISRCSTPETQQGSEAAILLTPTADNFPELQFPAKKASSTSAHNHNTKGKGRQSDADVDPDLTPTQANFSQSYSLVPYPQDKVPLTHNEDSESTKDRLEDIMARLDDAFDAEEWDPELPSVDRSNSPEPLTVKPQPVTYTTVGSLVKDNSIPQFTAPIRIQREGACRRPPQGPAQPRAHDGFFNPRTTPQFGLGFAGSSQHTQQYSQQRQPVRSPHNLSDPEKEDLLTSLGVMPAIRSGAVPTSSNLRAKADPFTMSPTADMLGPQRMLQHNSSMQSTQSLAPPPALGGNARNMQHLSYYSDPVQDAAFDRAARERLSESSAANLRSYNQTHATPASLRPSETLGLSNTGNGMQSVMKRGPESAQHKAGQLNLGYRFPPPGLPYPSNTTSSSADYSFQQSYNLPGSGLAGPSDAHSSLADYSRSGYNLQNSGTQDTVNLQNQAKPGYPQPLTAGPPGQRQNPTSGRQNLMPLLSILTGNSRSADGPSHLNRPPNSPWITSSGAYPRQNTFTSVPTEGSKIRDTLPPEEAAKYYPNGFPPDYSGVSSPLPEMLGKINLAKPAIEEETSEDAERKREEWWYHGVRKAHMTREDHLNELERLEVEHQSLILYGNAGVSHRPTLRPMREYSKFTIDQINKMTDAEVTAPLLDNLFGTLLGYADRVVIPNKLNMSELSRFGPSPAYQIDSSENGNNSFFGDDHGKVPKRWARDPRHHDLN